MTAVPLTVHNAQITTATVEIKTLTIKGKQVTLAVFRQILEQQVHYDARIWGYVNYHDKLCQAYHGHYSYTHYQLIWQLDEELRRCVIRAGIDEKYFAATLATIPQLFIAV